MSTSSGGISASFRASGMEMPKPCRQLNLRRPHCTDKSSSCINLRNRPATSAANKKTNPLIWSEAVFVTQRPRWGHTGAMEGRKEGREGGINGKGGGSKELWPNVVSGSSGSSGFFLFFLIVCIYCYNMRWALRHQTRLWYRYNSSLATPSRPWNAPSHPENVPASRDGVTDLLTETEGPRQTVYVETPPSNRQSTYIGLR